MAKFTPKTNKINNGRNTQGKNVNKPITFNKLPPPIPAKSSKEIKEISKYFKKNIKPIDKSAKNQSSNGNKN